MQKHGEKNKIKRNKGRKGEIERKRRGKRRRGEGGKTYN